MQEPAWDARESADGRCHHAGAADAPVNWATRNGTFPARVSSGLCQYRSLGSLPSAGYKRGSLSHPLYFYNKSLELLISILLSMTRELTEKRLLSLRSYA